MAVFVQLVWLAKLLSHVWHELWLLLIHVGKQAWVMMSGAILEVKENVNFSYVSPKKETTSQTTTSSNFNSILKPSQKENLEPSSSNQLNSKKGPKVSFKNTPVRHKPERYKAELRQQLDTWEEIRSLDEDENWTERTQVVTKEDHQLYLQAAKEILEDIINNLPSIKESSEPKIEPITTEVNMDTPEKLTKPKSPDVKIVKPIKGGIKSPPIPKCMESEFPDLTDDPMMVETDMVSSPGPLDPVIASVESYLSAGEEDVPKTFSPIGSERTSPSAENMIGSREDLDKLLAPHDDVPDNDDIIPPLHIHSHTTTDTSSTNTDLSSTGPTGSHDDVPVRPAHSPAEPTVGGEEPEASDDLDLSLPVRPRAAKPKKAASADKDDQMFKKPLPPKPWKVKKKKIPQQEDPFTIMFPQSDEGKADNASDGNSNTISSASTPVTSELSKDDNDQMNANSLDSAHAEQTDNSTQLESFAVNSFEGGEFSDSQQESLGFGDDDFKSAGDAFSLELDYLEKFGNSASMDRLSALARQSLYVKFDPLVKGASPEANTEANKMKADALSQKVIPSLGDDLFLINTPPSSRGPVSKLTAGGRPAAKNSPASIDKLLTFSPSAKPSAGQVDDYQPTQQNEETTAVDTEPSTTAQRKPVQSDSHLVQPLLFDKSDIEAALKKERDALLKQANEESAIRDMEIQEISKRCQKETTDNEKLRRENEELRTVMNEYERTMAEMIENSKKSQNMFDDSKGEVIKERDQLQADLNSVEAAFSDLHRRYEKIKGVVENFKKNEDILKKAARDYQEKLRKSEEKYVMLKKHAEEKIETANVEINRVRRSNDSEMAVMRAALKKEQTKVSSLEHAVQQKVDENKELTAICDELIQRASGPQ